MTDAPPRPQDAAHTDDRPSCGLLRPSVAPAGATEVGGHTDTRRERSILNRLVLVLAGTLSALILLTTVGGWTAYEYLGGQIHRIRLGLGGDRPADAAAGTRNYLLVGSDSRAGTGNEYQRGGPVTDERSDTTMLAHLAADGTTTMVSFPRDTLVRIPGHGRAKLNSAITMGGPGLLIRTIENLTDIKIDHYVSIDLAGFKAMTDALGGVTVCVKPLPDGSRSNLRDPWSQWRGQIGENRLNGEQALAFVRQRHGLPDNDFDRIRRQQQFVGAVFSQAMSTGVLTNPVRLEALLHAATRALTVDDGTEINDLRALATRLRGMSADQIRFETIPVHTPTSAEGANANGELPVFGAVQIYDPRALEQFLGPLRGRPRAATTAPPSPSPSVLPAAKVTVEVHNGAGIGGLASAAASRLAQVGFRTGAPQTWAHGTLRDTQVRYHPTSGNRAGNQSGSVAAARTVQAAVPGSQLQTDVAVPEGRVWLVLGTTFHTDEVVAPASPTTSGVAPAASVGSDASDGSTAPAPSAPGAGAAATATQLTAGCTY